MTQFINFCNFIFSRIIDILNSIKFGDSPSLLKFILASIIIGFIIKLIKGSSNEFEHSMNFSTPSIVSSVAVRYAKKNSERKKQIIKQKRENIVYAYMDDNY